MIAAQQVDSIRQLVESAVGESIRRFALDDALRVEIRKVAVEGNLAEADGHAEARELPQLGSEMCSTVADLLWRGFVSRGSAADHGSDPCISKAKAIFPRGTFRLAGETSLVQNRVHEVTGTIARKGSARAIGSMGSGGEAKDEKAGPRIAEARNWASPVGLVLIGASLGLTNLLTVAAQANAAFAGDDGLVNLEQRSGKRFGGKTCHSLP